MIKKCALWLRDSFIRNRSLNATRIVAGSFAAIILIGALLLAGGAGALGCSAAALLKCCMTKLIILCTLFLIT